MTADGANGSTDGGGQPATLNSSPAHGDRQRDGGSGDAAEGIRTPAVRASDRI